MQLKLIQLKNYLKKIDAPYLKQAVEDFNFLTDVKKRDMFLNRKIETMRSL